MPDPKRCFVICPIGDEGTDIRKRSNQILKFVIMPVVKDFGYETVRADQIPKPGTITGQVIEHLKDDALVIADLADYNPNVMYELAVRHAVRKAVVQLRKKGQPLPFDVGHSRTIELDFPDPESMEQCRDQLRKQIATVEKDPSEADNPISNAIDLQASRKSDNPGEKNYAEIMTSIQDLKSTVLDAIRNQTSTRVFGISPGTSYPPGSSESPIFQLSGVPVFDFGKLVLTPSKREEKKGETDKKKSS